MKVSGDFTSISTKREDDGYRCVECLCERERERIRVKRRGERERYEGGEQERERERDKGGERQVEKIKCEVEPDKSFLVDKPYIN